MVAAMQHTWPFGQSRRLSRRCPTLPNPTRHTLQISRRDEAAAQHASSQPVDAGSEAWLRSTMLSTRARRTT
ncbi:hypothetical protein KEM60_00303 [Austwickia sp. TVS 96-490-7B]|nr:hypothetical protein [Austwickia sp. TVS 96-490-7B]